LFAKRGPEYDKALAAICHQGGNIQELTDKLSRHSSQVRQFAAARRYSFADSPLR
jgi:hypothetical protein